jgi:hypothetical protein
VPLDRVDEYTAAWARLRASATSANMNAWLFRGTDHEDHFMEFLEWSDDGAPAPMPDRDQIATLREELEENFGHGHEDRWDEVVTASSSA